MKLETMGALLVGVALAASGCQQKGGGAQTSTGASPSPAATLSDDEKAVQALGGAMGAQASQMATQLKLTPAEQEIFKKAFSAALAGEKPAVAFDQPLQQRLATRAQANEKQKAAEYSARAAQEPGAVKTASGLIYRTLKPGTGASPKATDVVQVGYRGTLTDGTEFDSSAKHGGPAQFQVNGVIPCWTEAVQKMKVGEQARLVCPSEIAYGDAGRPPVIPGGATLVFEVELLGIGAKRPAASGQGR
jgi:FKBP-type peptidyl-prolyl cis-trans isomerase FkpA